MTNPSQIAMELGTIVSAANECAETLLALLEEERTALSSGDVAGIDSSGQKKTECVAELEGLDRERIELCRLLALTEADIESFLAQHNAGGTTGPGWHQFLTKLEQCREANSVNGRITRTRRRHIEQALQVLRGNVADGPGLYGANGLDDVKDATTLGQA